LIILKYLEYPMPSVKKCADLLREQAYKTLAPQIQALEDELRDVDKLLASGIRNIGYKLDALRHTELPAAGAILDEYLRDDIRKRDLEGEMLALFMRGLRTKETQEEILTSLLDGAANCFPRIALFAVRGDMFKGWSSRGFSNFTAKTISSDEFRQADCSWMLEILRNGEAESAELPDTGSLRLMRGEASGVWRVYPLHVLGRPAAILFAGEAEGFMGRPNALAVLMDCVALRLENVALKIIKTLNESALAGAAATVFAAESLFNVPPASRLPGEISSGVLSLNLTAPIEIPAPVKSVNESHHAPDAFQPNPLPEPGLVEKLPEPVVESPADEPSEPGQGTIIGSTFVEYVSESEPVAEIPASEPFEPEQETIIESAFVEYIGESEPVAKVPADELSEPELNAPQQSAPPPLNMEVEKLHTAAKRFAELLVSGIRLYNEDAVAEGRKNRDLYKRLQGEMVRSREIYEKRVAPTVAGRVDYLHDEFLRILGDGDAGAFGDGYPGSRIREQTGL
jgi:hypothetical protein